MYQRSQSSIRFGLPTEAPAKAGVWGWVQSAYAAYGGEHRGVGFENSGSKPSVRVSI